jgi:hypothetical protein
VKSFFALVLCLLLLVLSASACTTKGPYPPSSGPAGSTGAKSDEQSNGATLDQSGNTAPGKPGTPNNKPVMAKGANGLPAGWPKDVPVMDGLTLQHAGPTQDGLDAMLIGNVTADKVEAFYTGLSGWTRRPDTSPQAPGNPGDQNSSEKTFVMTKGTETLTVSLAAQEAQTSVRLFYSKK